MPSYSTNLKTWGSSGQEYPDGYNYEEGEQPVDAWDNFVTSNLIADIDHLVSVTNNDLLAADGSVNATSEVTFSAGIRVGSNEGVTDDTGTKAVTFLGSGDVDVQNGQLYEQGNPVATESYVDSTTSGFSGDHADLTNVTAGQHRSDQNILNTVDGTNIDITGDADTVDGQDYADIQNWVNNNADVPNADHADNADNATNATNADDADTLDGEHASAFADANHTHDSRYYTESEVDGFSLNKWSVPTQFDVGAASRMRLPQRTTDPSAVAGDIWYRSDLD
jgi:hypothetical protein